MSSYGKLYLIPVPISEENPLNSIPSFNCGLVKKLDVFIAEDAKTARRFLKLFGYSPLERAEIMLLNEHSQQNETEALIKPLLAGKDVGLMSDAGCPGIADPGAALVALAHKKGVEVLPLTGPSSVVLSVMASGFNGQNFAFNGYLPVEKVARIKKIKELEQLSQRIGQAQFFIETPYRNSAMLESLLATLQPATQLFLGIDIGAASQKLISKPVAGWKEGTLPAVHKIPVVFGIYRSG